LQFSIVSEIQYARMHEDFTTSGVKFAVDFGTRGGASTNVWLFPLLLRYDLRRSRLSPFVDAGATLRHLSSFDGHGFQLDFFLHPQPMTFHFPIDTNPKVAITAGAGVKLRVLIFDVAPEIRFEHWTGISFIPVQNQATLGVGITFPVRR
jgi:opacity protein-like surface antigen